MKKFARMMMLAIAGLLVSACPEMTAQDGGGRTPPDNHQLVTIRQGIWGNVWLWQGDFMPSPGGANRGKVTAVRREVLIYKPTSMKATVPSTGSKFRKVKSRLVAKVKSRRNGFYQVSLPPGRYSIFVRDGSTLYANWFDGQGYVMPVAVVKDSVTKFQIDLTEGATY